MSLIILDRDGVINYDSDEYIKSPEEWHPIPGSLAAIAELNQNGFQVAVATNQSGVARGYYDEAMLEQIHQKMLSLLAEEGGEIEAIFYCPHHPNDDCSCRKPKPGMLYQIAEHFEIDLEETYFIGDSFTDVEAAYSAGCQPLFVLTGRGEENLARFPQLEELPNFVDLAAAVDYVIQNKS